MLDVWVYSLWMASFLNVNEFMVEIQMFESVALHKANLIETSWFDRLWNLHILV
jgi:hypothetical protein